MTVEKRLPPGYDANANKSRADSESDDENIRLSQSRGDPAGANAVFSCLGLFIQILTSTTGLFIINLFFLLLGSYIFYLIEAPKEEALQNNLHSLRETLVDQLIILGHGDAASYDGNASEKLAIYEGHLANFYRKRATLNIDYGNSTTGQTKLWTAYGAIIYCYSIITTIGWGNIVASTLPGRMATIVYGLFGMPLLFTLSTDVGNIVSFCNLKLWHLLKHIYKKIYRLTLNKDHHHHHHHHHHHQQGKAGKKDDDDEDDTKSKKSRSSGSLGSGGSKSSLASRGSRSSTASHVSLTSDSFGGSMDDFSPNRYFSDPGEVTSLNVRYPRDDSKGYPRYLNKAKNNAAYLASVESTIDFIMEFTKLKDDADAVYRYPHKRILCKRDAVRLSEKFDSMSVNEIVKCMEFAGFPMEQFETILEDMREKHENGGARSSVSSHTVSDNDIILGQPETVESFESKTKQRVVYDDDDHARGDSLKEAKREIEDQGGGEPQRLNRNDSKPPDRAFQKRTKLTQTTRQLSSHTQGEAVENVAKCRDGSTRSCPPAKANGPGFISERAGDVLDVKSLAEGHFNPLQRPHNRPHAVESRSGPCVGDKGMLRNGHGDGEFTRPLPENTSHSYEGFNETQAKTREISKLASGVKCNAALDGSCDIEIANFSTSAATSMVKESKDFEVNGNVSLETKSHGTIEDTAKQTDLTEPIKNVRCARNDKTAVKMGDDLVGSRTKRLAEIFNTVFQVERMGFGLNDPKFNVDNDALVGIRVSTTELTAANLSKHNSLLYDAPPKYEKLKHFAGQRSRVDSTPKNEDYEFVKKWNIQRKKPQHLRAYPAVLSAAGSNDMQSHVSLSSGRKPEAIPKEKQLIDYFVSVAVGDREGTDLDVHSFTNPETKVSSLALTSKCQIPEQNEKTIDLTSNSPTLKNAEATLQSSDGQIEPQTIASSKEMKSHPVMNTIGDPQQSRNLPRILQPHQNKKISLVQGESVNFESVVTSDENQLHLQAGACVELRGKHSNAGIDRKASITGNDSKQPALCEETLRFEGSRAKNYERILRSHTEEMKSRLGRVKVHGPQPMDYNQSADEDELEAQAKRDILQVMMKKKKQYLARAIDEEDDEEEDDDDNKKDDGNQAEDYHLPLLVLYAFVIMYVLIGSTVYYTLSYDSSFTFLDAIYFIYVLLSTTGFGDILPENHMYYFTAVYGLLGMAIFNVLINATLETLLSALDYINAIAVAVDNDEYFDEASGSETSYD